MANWVDKYKQLIASSHKRHVIVADQDNLLDYAELRQNLYNDGFAIIETHGPLEVRIRFELEVRENDKKCLLVAGPSYSPPPDISNVVHFKAIGLKDLFPHLDAKAIQGLSFNALCLLSNIKPYEELGPEKTLKFLLENLYNIDFNTLAHLRPKEKILGALITIFLEKDAVNKPLSSFIADFTRPYFPELVKKGLDRQVILDYLREQWNDYLSNNPCEIDFEDTILNKTFGYLIVFDHLHPVKVTDTRFQSIPESLRIGAFVDEGENNDRELETLISYLEQQQSVIEDLYHQWFSLIQVLAKARINELNSKNQLLKSSFNQVTTTVNKRFQRFIDNTYSSLFTLSGVRHPVVISRVLEYIKAHPEQRKALLVIDGMNYWQWLLIADTLQKAGVSVQSKTTLAFIPTITAWSRQALFRGNKPDLKENNSRESTLFSEFWERNGYLSNQIYFQQFGCRQPLNVDDIPENVHILGLVTNDLDDVMHGTFLGNGQLMDSTSLWIKKSKIIDSIQALRSKNFKIFITTDHGNVEAKGIKNLKLRDKVGSLSRGKRHIHFSNETMLANFIELNPDLTIGLRDTSVYLRHEEAFTDTDATVITHGGSNIWEVLIPLGEIL